MESGSADETGQIAVRLAQLLCSGDVMCLEGELGAGKTRFAQGIGAGLGVSNHIVSPTFTLIREYATGRPSVKLYHIDLYRIHGADDALAFGIEDYIYGDGICVIEWADRIRDILPADRLWITFHHTGETQRCLQLGATNSHYERVLASLV